MDKIDDKYHNKSYFVVETTLTNIDNLNYDNICVVVQIKNQPYVAASVIAPIDQLPCVMDS